MWVEILVSLLLLAALIWIAATAFVRTRGYPGHYFHYIGVTILSGIP